MAGRKKTIQHSHAPTLSDAVALNRMKKLFAQIPELRSPEAEGFETWLQNVKLLLADCYGVPSPVVDAFGRIWFTPGVYYSGQPRSEFVRARSAGLTQAEGFLASRVEDLEEKLSSSAPGIAPSISSEASSSTMADPTSIFVVHGHDSGTKETIARFLSKLGLNPIILHEKADRGRTLIEKFEDHSSQASCAVVLLTPDDSCSCSARGTTEMRARQNVVLELGFFVGRLGRERTFALTKTGVQLPSDIQGLIYISLDSPDWQIILARELKAANIPFDAHKLLS